MKYKVAKELEDNKHIDSEVILYNNEILTKVLDKLNKALIVYDTFADKSAEKLSSVLVGNTTQITTTGKNLFNKNNVTLEKRLSNTGKEYNDREYFLSEYIEVEENTQYTKTPIFTDLFNRIGFYDSDKKLIFTDDGGNKSTITTPEGTKYLRFGDLITNLDKEQLEKGNSATSYEPYTGGQPSPSPEYPQEIKSVIGKHKLNVAVGEETKAFDLDLGDLELNKLLTYSDKINFVNDKWIKEDNIFKFVCKDNRDLLSNTLWCFNNSSDKVKEPLLGIRILGNDQYRFKETNYSGHKNIISNTFESKGTWNLPIENGTYTTSVGIDFFINYKTIGLEEYPNNFQDSIIKNNTINLLINKNAIFYTIWLTKKEKIITDTNLIIQLNTILNYLISLELKGQTYTLSLEDVE